MSIDRLAQAARLAAEGRRTVRATYRLQMHGEFTIEQARGLVEYLHCLGISHVYASPLLAAKPGSRHCYDVRNHDLLNPEIGTEEQLQSWSNELAARGMGIVLDVVPNHMCVGCENAWWADVLEHGPSSPYAGYFDIAWNDHPQQRLRGKVLLPILGEPYGQVLESGRFQPRFENGAFLIQFDAARLPIDPRTYGTVLVPVLEGFRDAIAAGDSNSLELQSVLTAIQHLPARDEADPGRLSAARSECVVIKRRLAELASRDRRVDAAIWEQLARIAGTPGDIASFNALEQWLDAQAYRLSYWRVATDEINYRRFFDINEFAAISLEREDVFWASHRKVFEWLASGRIDGLRIDHPDGLFNPREYLQRLQVFHLLAHARHILEHSPQEYGGMSWEEAEPQLRQRFETSSEQALYVVVEKILGPNEPLPADWLTRGTTGYDFVNAVNGLFIDPRGEGGLTRLFQDFSRQDDSFEETVYQKKFLIQQTSLASELHVLAHQLDRLAQRDRRSRDFTLNGLRHALREVIACFPVYRSYVESKASDSDRVAIVRSIVRARRRNPVLGSQVFDFIRGRLLLLDPPSGPPTPEYMQDQQRFAGKFQQVTAPVMAKGFEDTALYIYNRLISLNEVGGYPPEFAWHRDRLNQYFAERAVKLPGSLSPLSTHDSKRSEDVRARINVLSEIPDEFRKRVEIWSRWNAHFKTEIERDLIFPEPNAEYLLYQTLVGTWPLEEYTSEVAEGYSERVRAYMNKAAHEAKVHTSWINPDSAYDEALAKFVSSVLDPAQSPQFIADMAEFQRQILPAGLLNALSQTVIRCLAPGVPDTYQGTELWDFSLVDPDNRRPVDFEFRRRWLRGIDEQAAHNRREFVRQVSRNRMDGRIKLFATAESLRLRRELNELFHSGEYSPLHATGLRADHVFAFSWRTGRHGVIAAVPRLTQNLPGDASRWEATSIPLPAEWVGQAWSNRFTGVAGTLGDHLTAQELFADFPVALLSVTDPGPQVIHQGNS